MKHWLPPLCAALAVCLLSACAAPAPKEEVQPAPPPDAVAFTDALGYETVIESWDRVVSLYGSFAETWQLAGGELVGATSDAIQERQLDLGDAAVVGTVKEPNLEEIIAADPDFVILAADIAAQAALHDALVQAQIPHAYYRTDTFQEYNLEEIIAADPDFVILAADIAAQAALHDALVQAQIPHAYYRTDTFQEYLAMLKDFCTMTGRQDLYEKNGQAVQQEIDAVLEAVAGQSAPTALLIRAYSSGAKAKGSDNLAGAILEDLGAENLVSRHGSLLEDLSMEEIIAADPDFILLTTMGASDDAAVAFMAKTFEADPAWQELSAVQNGRYVLLPRDLFHYKPNARWGESYAYLADILYPDLPRS